MASQDNIATATNQIFQLRTRFFFLGAAQDILNEVWGGDPDEGAARQAFATAIVNNGVSTETLCYSVLTNPTVAAAGVDVTDNDLQFTCVQQASTLAKAWK